MAYKPQPADALYDASWRLINGCWCGYSYPPDPRLDESTLISCGCAYKYPSSYRLLVGVLCVVYGGPQFILNHQHQSDILEVVVFGFI